MTDHRFARVITATRSHAGDALMLGRSRPPAWQRGSGPFQRPARVIAGGFATAALIGTGLLSLPAASESGHSVNLIDALFTATSAVCVTGLVTVDTGTQWSTFGQLVILALIQIGGLGIMTLATLFALLVSRRIGLRTRLLAQAETRTLSGRDVRRVVRSIALFSLASEAVTALLLTGRLITAYGEPVGRALYDGIFHAISAFNNAGFSLNSDSLMRYVRDPWVSLTIATAVIVGGLGFPVVFELSRNWRRPKQWTILTRVTVTLTVALLAVGTVVFFATEYHNPGTLGAFHGPGKLLAAFFTSAMTRTAGFNSLNIAAMTPRSLFVSDMLMFIGGGSAGTAGGIKVTTFGLLALVIWAEMRGEPRVNAGRRRVPETNQRQALAIALLGIGMVALATFILLDLSDYSLDRVLFEATSAFATVGLSTGITAGLPTTGKLLLVVLMFIGRIGPLTLASALALKERPSRLELPEERTVVG